VDMMIWYKPKAISGMMTGRGLDKNENKVICVGRITFTAYLNRISI
jgi:hypothetical protein